MPAKNVRQRTTKIRNDRLKSYLDATKNESVLLGPVDRHIQMLPGDRDESVIHPSEMAATDWCPRATWHRLMEHPVINPSPVTLRSALIFDTGKDIHRKWQHWLKDMGILWGTWKCRVCNAYVNSWSNQLPFKCVRYEGPHLWQYREVYLESVQHNIKGRADGIVNPAYDENMLLEIKSVGPGTMRSLDLMDIDDADEMSSEKFSRITRPATAHFRQTQIYLRLAEMWEEDIGPVRRAVVVYEHKADQKVREFVVTRNDRYTDPLFDLAMDIVWAVGNDREMHCPHGGCNRCRAYEGLEPY